MSEEKKNIKELLLEEYDKGNIVFMTNEGLSVVPIDKFVRQGASGVLYDLNHLESVALTYDNEDQGYMNVNDFAVAKVIRHLYDKAFGKGVDDKKD